MRASLVLLAALVACSDASGPRQIPVLTTQLSSSAESVSGVLTVTLTASNPTDTTLHLAFTAPAVTVEIQVEGQWQGAGPLLSGGFLNLDTLSLVSGAVAPLGSVNVEFSSSTQPSAESFSLSPGTYAVRACYYPATGAVTGHAILLPVCGNSVALTLTP
jgi:hypothetical protein